MNAFKPGAYGAPESATGHNNKGTYQRPAVLQGLAAHMQVQAQASNRLASWEAEEIATSGSCCWALQDGHPATIPFPANNR